MDMRWGALCSVLVIQTVLERARRGWMVTRVVNEKKKKGRVRCSCEVCLWSEDGLVRSARALPKVEHDNGQPPSRLYEH